MNTSTRPPVWQLVRDAVREIGGEVAYSEIRQHIWQRFPDVNAATITCQTIACSVNVPSRVHYPENKSPRLCTGQYDVLFNVGRGKVAWFDPSVHGNWEISQKGDGMIVRLVDEMAGEAAALPDDEARDGGAFALEAHLRDYLAKNLPTLPDAGALRLFVSTDRRDGVEFQTDVGPIDILAVSDRGDFYVLELKLLRGADAALGQVLRYMGWVKKHLAADKQVFGIIVASDIGAKLRYAATQVPQVRLMEYELKVALSPCSLA